VFAARRHEDQRRKGTDIPYVSHLLAVCALVVEAGGDEDCAIAALLHDVVEDQKATIAEIEELFGGEVAGVVVECSDTDEEPKPPWRARKQAFLARMPELSDRARLVVTADKLHNASATLADVEAGDSRLWEKFNGGREGTLWYYRSIADALGSDDALSRRLAATVDRLEELAGGQQ